MSDQAFPNDKFHDDRGLTKREYAAIQAMKGIISNASMYEAMLLDAKETYGFDPALIGLKVTENIANVAILQADKLLEKLDD